MGKTSAFGIKKKDSSEDESRPVGLDTFEQSIDCFSVVSNPDRRDGDSTGKTNCYSPMGNP